MLPSARLSCRTAFAAWAVFVLACDGNEPRPEAALAARPGIAFNADTSAAHFGTVTLGGIPHGRLQSVPETAWRTALRLHTEASIMAEAEHPAVLGTYSIAGDTLRFRPRFPLHPGLTYRARFDGAKFDSLRGATIYRTPSASLTFTMPPRGEPRAAHVVAVYPSARRVPENLLRIYVHFSAPMRTKNIHERVHVFEKGGAEVELAFVEIKHGLWDPQEQRLTLFFHPGRIKRGVAPNRTLGTPLRAGTTYRLVIDAAAQDALGRPLTRAYEHAFEVMEADRESPDPRSWVVVSPQGGHSPVALEFAESLDRAMLERMLRVFDAAGQNVPGSATVSDQERRWSFLPKHPWPPGPYTIHVPRTLEDLAGNTLQRRFDEEVAEPPARVADNDVLEPVELRFRVGGPQNPSP